jgi:hypothetical protein
VDLKLVKSSGSFEIERIEDEESSESTYLVRIHSGHSLGFTTSEHGVLEDEFKNLILAFNLNLDRAFVTYKKGEFSLHK